MVQHRFVTVDSLREIFEFLDDFADDPFSILQDYGTTDYENIKNEIQLQRRSDPLSVGAADPLAVCVDAIYDAALSFQLMISGHLSTISHASIALATSDEVLDFLREMSNSIEKWEEIIERYIAEVNEYPWNDIAHWDALVDLLGQYREYIESFHPYVQILVERVGLLDEDIAVHRAEKVTGKIDEILETAPALDEKDVAFLQSPEFWNRVRDQVAKSEAHEERRLADPPERILILGE